MRASATRRISPSLSRRSSSTIGHLPSRSSAVLPAASLATAPGRWPNNLRESRSYAGTGELDPEVVAEPGDVEEPAPPRLGDRRRPRPGEQRGAVGSAHEGRG